MTKPVLRPKARREVVRVVREMKAALGLTTYRWTPHQSEMVYLDGQMKRVRTVPDEDLPENQIKEWLRLQRDMEEIAKLATSLVKLADRALATLDGEE
jgi:hypothetical protein